MSSEGKEKGKDPIEITSFGWTDLFLAWIIDLILLSIALGLLFAEISFPIWTFDYNEMTRIYYSIESVYYNISSLAFFGHWIYFNLPLVNQ